MSSQFTFITSYETDYSRSGVLLSFLSKKDLVREVIKFNSWKSLMTFARQIFKANRKTDYYVIMNPSQFLTPVVRVLTFKKIILDSGWPLTEKSRAKNISKKEKLLRAKTWIIDFASMHLANLVLLESQLQKERTSNRFKINRKKLEVSLTGVDNLPFSLCADTEKLNGGKFKVGFRGRYNLEAGLEVLAETSLLCRDLDISFLVLSPNIPNNIKFGENTDVKNRIFASKDEMAALLNSCDLLLGQLSNHPRLDVTIPHKAFEAAIMGKPYLSARARGIQEFLVEGIEAEYFDAGNAIDLLKKIIELKNNKNHRIILSKNIYKKYIAFASEKAIGDAFLTILKQKFHDK
jgi:glycosyltransferase involved in cell wall biosynthesis